tara:strand:+ start:2115 stop:4937 length:2823 start_codon:yes stop_codon:yes gene_type:complete
MTQHVDDPCRDSEIPPSGEPTGQPREPDVPNVVFSEPIFPEIEQDFEGLPISRKCTIVPRNLYFNYRQYDIRYPEEANFLNYTLRNPNIIISRSTPRRLDEELKEIDVFRWVSGKFYNSKSTKYIWNKELKPNDQFGLDFRIEIGPTRTFVPVDEPNPYGMSTYKNNITCTMEKQAISKRFIDEPVRFDELQYFVKIMLQNRSSQFESDPQDRTYFVDDAFTAPASYFEKEADGLNLILKNTTSMKVFIPESVTYNEEQAGSEILKTSAYEKFSMEYFERIQYCPPGEGVSVHKFPSREIQLLNEITKLATERDSQSEYASFYRVFNREYDYYTRISFDTSHESPVAAKIKEDGLDTLFLSIIDYMSPSDETLHSQILDERLEAFTGVADNDGVSVNYRPNTYEKITDKLIDFTSEPSDFQATLYEKIELILDLATFPLFFDGVEDWIFELDAINSDVYEPTYTLLKHLKSNALKDWFKEYVETQNKKRTFKKILENKLSHSEIIAYRLEKRNAETDEIIQNFYFFNDPDTNTVDFIDTQVSFSKTYKYRIYAINIVFGSQYKYSFVDEDLIRAPNGDFIFSFDAISRPKISYIESPYFEQDLLITDAPPMPPDVWFLPVTTMEEELVQFWFIPRLGNEKARPIGIFEDDLETIQRMKLSQNVSLLGDEEITYKSDSDPTHYEILVLDEPPSSYFDFALARRDETTIESPRFIKRVLRNKDYYITFRARDRAGISNPTRVFRYRLASTPNTAPEHEIEEYEFQNETEEFLISFNQAFQIEPGAEQTAINTINAIQYPDASENMREFSRTSRGLENVTLGIDSENNLWADKKFVFEIVSAITGKKILIKTNWSQNIIQSLPGLTQESYRIESEEGTELNYNCLESDRQRQYQANNQSANVQIQSRTGGADPARSSRVRGTTVTRIVQNESNSDSGSDTGYD